MINNIDHKQQLVSIAMASYNGAKYIEEQLNSIINQTYKNIEVVVVDDVSSDNTIEIVKKYQERYSFIKLFENKKNLGVTKTFEAAINNCNGVFIALCDQDDIWELDKIDILVAGIGNHDAVYSNSLLVDEKGKSLGVEFKSIMNMASYYSGTPFLLSNSVPGHTILVKTDFLKTIIPIPEKLLFDLWIGFNAGGNNGIKFIDKVLVKYRQHATNTIGTKKSTNKKKKKVPVDEQFKTKLLELKLLATATITHQETKLVLQQMIALFTKRWSFKRSAFFFKYFNEILSSKKKPHFRKKLYCVKMFFKPNF